jgi:aldose 1-epimerase
LPAPVILQSGRQRLSVLPDLGGSIAAWDWQQDDRWTALFRPWDGRSRDLYSTACFPLVPWSNRITDGGFEAAGSQQAISPNRSGEIYPIHGDGWLQAWQITMQSDDRLTLELHSDQFDGNPYRYHAKQLLTLRDNALELELRVANTGRQTLPFGLGLHPYFPRDAETRLQFRSRGVWLCGADPIPTGFTQELPPGWDYNRAAALDGPLIDNCYEGWDGIALIDYPQHKLRLHMHTQDRSGYTLLYRPPGLDYFCLEPITHPIDAFHMPGRPGLIDLAPGADMVLLTRFSVSEL